MTRPTSVAIGLSAAAAAFSLTIVNSLGGVASAAAAPQKAASPSSADLATLQSIDVQPAWFLSSIKNHASKPTTHVLRAKTYRAEPGDSFWSIAKKEHVDWFNLAADNGMKMYETLMVGRVLHLPKPGEAPHAPMALQSPEAPVATVSAPRATTTASITAVSQPVAQPTVSQPVAQPTSSQTVTQPSVASSSTVSTQGDSSFESCVISRESGGNSQVTNASGHYGLFQFSESTWVGYGGNAADFGHASASEQEQVFNNAMARGGEDNWAPYDGC